MKLVVKVFVLVGVIVGFSGCGTIQVKEPSEMALTHGYVVGAMHSENSIGLEIKSESGKSWKIPAPRDFKATKTIETWVPAGTYTLKNVLSQSIVNDDTIALSEDAFPKIIIKAGEVTDLNHIIPVHLGKGKYTVLSLKRNEPFSSTKLEKLQAVLGNLTTNHWFSEESLSESKIKFGSSGLGLIPDLITAHGKKREFAEKIDLLKEAKTHQQAFDIVKSFGMPSTFLYKSPAGNYYFGTNIGQIRYLDGEEWKVIDTGYLAGVMAVEYLSNDHIVVGLDSGKVIESVNNGADWNLRSVVSNDELIFDIKSVNQELFVGTWVPDTENGTQIFGVNKKIIPTAKIYKVVGNELVEQYSLEGTDTYTWNYKPTFEVNDETIFVTLPPKTIHAFNTQSGTGKQLIFDKYYSGFDINEEKDILIRWFSGGLRSNALRLPLDCCTTLPKKQCTLCRSLQNILARWYWLLNPMRPGHAFVWLSVPRLDTPLPG